MGRASEDFIFLNGHFDNGHVAKGEILQICSEYSGALIYWKDFWDFAGIRELSQRSLKESGGHADAIDVALMMHLAPNEIDTERLVAEFPKLNAFVSHDLQERFITRSGVIGSRSTKSNAGPRPGAL